MDSPTLQKPPYRSRREESPAPVVPVPPGPHGNEGFHEDELPNVENLPRPKRSLLVLIGVVLAIVLAGAFAYGLLPKLHTTADLNAEAQARADALPTVSVQLPTKSATASKLELPGNVQALQETDIYARTTGYLKQWLVDYGARVNKDQLLGVIDSPEIDEQLRQARGMLASDEANVSKGELDLQLTDVTQKRYEALINTQGVTPQELDTYHANYAKARTALAMARASVVADLANVKRLEDMQSFERITAPFAGTITARNYDVGALITANGTSAVQPIFKIQETDVLRAWVSVPQSYSTMMKPGLHAKLTVREYPHETFVGAVAHTAGALDPSTRTLLTEVRVPNPDGRLLAGMFAQVTFEITNPAPPLMIPVGALITNAGDNQVAVVGSDDICHYKNVELGRDYGITVEVTSGLSGDERIVTNPGERLSEGVKVRVLGADARSAPATPKDQTKRPG